MQKYHLIIWEEIPEEVHLYLIPSSVIFESFSEEELISINEKYMGMAYLNSDIEEIIDRLSCKLSECICYKNEGFVRINDNQHIETIIRTGFFL